jgi:hypothetical protein
MTAVVLNRAGLILGMIGVVLIFVWGPPQPALEEGVGLGLEDATPLPNGRTVAEHDQAIRRLRKRHTILSRAGLVFLGLGFLAQFLATYE